MFFRGLVQPPTSCAVEFMRRFEHQAVFEEVFVLDECEWYKEVNKNLCGKQNKRRWIFLLLRFPRAGVFYFILFLSGQKGYAHSFFPKKFDIWESWRLVVSRCDSVVALPRHIAAVTNGMSDSWKLKTVMISLGTNRLQQFEDAHFFRVAQRSRPRKKRWSESWH